MRRCFHALHTTTLLPGSSSLFVQRGKVPDALLTTLAGTTRRFLSQHSSANLSTELAAQNNLFQTSTENDEDPCVSFEQCRNDFSTALRILQAMTPQTLSTVRPVSLQDCLGQQEAEAHNLRPKNDFSRSRCSLRRFNPHFWNRLRDLTRSEEKCSAGNAARLTELFDDPLHARDLNLEAYTIVIAFCVRTNDFYLLRSFMEHAQKSHVVPDTMIANTMLGILVNIPSLSGWSAALRVFAILRLQADTSTWNQLLALSNPKQQLIVLDRMQALAVPKDTVTLGTLIPLASAQFDSIHAFIDSMHYTQWDPRLGDVLVGHLLSLKNSQACIDLLQDMKFPVTIEGHNQVISHLRKIPAMKVNHQKLARTVCRALLKRGLAPDVDTFLFLFKLSAFIRTKDYGDMVYKVAAERKLLSKELILARKAQLRQRRYDSVVLTRSPMSWKDWLSLESSSQRETTSKA